MNREIRAPGFVVPSGYDRTLALASVGPGWAFLLDTLFDRIEHEAKYGTIICISQVKEKFGCLRVYASVEAAPQNMNSQELFGYISALEDISKLFCESCYLPMLGVLRHGSWLQTLCDHHARGCPPLVKEE